MIQWYEQQPPGAPVNPITRTAQSVPVDIVDRDVDLGTIALRPHTEIEGRVVFRGTNPFPVRITLDPSSGEFLNLLASRTSSSGEEGTFS